MRLGRPAGYGVAVSCQPNPAAIRLKPPASCDRLFAAYHRITTGRQFPGWKRSCHTEGSATRSRMVQGVGTQRNEAETHLGLFWPAFGVGGF